MKRRCQLSILNCHFVCPLFEIWTKSVQLKNFGGKSNKPIQHKVSNSKPMRNKLHVTSNPWTSL